jgi:uncharacterized membrane protein YobD (UPF0266 family)
MPVSQNSHCLSILDDDTFFVAGGKTSLSVENDRNNTNDAYIFSKVSNVNKVSKVRWKNTLFDFYVCASPRL